MLMRASGVFVGMVVLSGCSVSPIGPQRTLALRWQRLIDAKGQTCDRCGVTQTEVRLAADTLRRSLRPLNMKVDLQEVPMDPATFARDTSQSNRIFVDGRALEDWLGAQVGMSPCGGCCGELGEKVECRTICLDDRTYEAIPTVLIIRAGLLAAEASLAGQLAKAPCRPPGQPSAAKSCCPR